MTVPTTANAEYPLSERDYRALLTTRLRSQTLLADGYTIEVEAKPGIYTIITPEKHYKGTAYHNCYSVDMTAGTCECVMFARAGECKHLIAVTRAVAEAVRLLGPMLPASVPAVIAPSLFTVNGKTFTDRAAADAYRKELDFA